MDETLLLSSVAAGNREAADQLVPLVYQELKRLASSYMRRERPDHTLQAAALVNLSQANTAGGKSARGWM